MSEDRGKEWNNKEYIYLIMTEREGTVIELTVHMNQCHI